MLHNVNLNNSLPVKDEKLRPLGVISDVVVEKLPAYGTLEKIKEDKDFSDSLERLLSDCLSACRRMVITPDPLAILDLKMLLVSASVGGFREIAEPLATMARALMVASDRPDIAHMTYEDIIFNNPAADMRHFCAGSIGQSEIDFYRGHQTIEQHLSTAIILLSKARDTSCADGLEQAVQHIGIASEWMRSFLEDLNREHFKAFKPFFDTNPFTGEKGPSGAFSAKVPLVDVLLNGNQLPSATTDYVNSNASYFPVADYQSLLKAMQHNKRGLDIIFSHDAEAKKHILQMAEHMLTFRQRHRGAMVKHIGRDGHGSAEGHNALQFLTDRITNTRQGVQRIKGVDLG